MQLIGSATVGVSAAGSITGATGVAFARVGQFAPARTGAGVYTITFAAGNGVPATDSIILTSIRGATTGIIKAVHTSDLIKTISTVTIADAAADRDFDFAVIVFPAGD